MLGLGPLRSQLLRASRPNSHCRLLTLSNGLQWYPRQALSSNGQGALLTRVTPSCARLPWPQRSFASTTNSRDHHTGNGKEGQSSSNSSSKSEGGGRNSGHSSSSSASRPSLLSMAGMKELARKYGKIATLVYFGVSVIDLSACVWIVRAAGEAKVKQIEDWVMEHLGNWAIVGRSPQQVFDEAHGTSAAQDSSSTSSSSTVTAPDAADNQGAVATGGGPSWTSTFVIAYSIHKLLVPIRVPITVFITPSIAARLRRMGYFLPKK